jgi:hypothetical protein
MSTFSLARGPRGVVGAWEVEGRIRCGSLERRENAHTASGESEKCRFPSIAVGRDGAMLVAWIEDMGWKQKGTLAWRILDKTGKTIANGRGEEKGLRPWSLVQSVALPDGRFAILR